MLPAGAADPRGPLTIGTAGHVDHGKTALVAALTGVDTDRLPEEKRRGLSIELGYAPLELPSGRRVSIVDVPGHERFIRTMVAGATGVDCWLMVIAATDGVKPQTREHARILQALGIERGIVVITKTDRADGTAAVAQARELLPGIPVVVCPAHLSARRPVVLEALDRFVAQIDSRERRGGPAIMHIDRCFTIDGAGTVVTGTLSSGQIRRGETLSVYPAVSCGARAQRAGPWSRRRAGGGRPARRGQSRAGTARRARARGRSRCAGRAPGGVRVRCRARFRASESVDARARAPRNAGDGCAVAEQRCIARPRDWAATRR